MEKDSFKDMFMFETNDLIQQLEEIIMESERAGSFDMESVNAVFRIMHTIKGSASMMTLQNIAVLAHALEDLFDYFRAENVAGEDRKVMDIVLESLDFIKLETEKFGERKNLDGDPSVFVEKAENLLKMLKSGEQQVKEQTTEPDKRQTEHMESRAKMPGEETSDEEQAFGRYKATIFYEEDCGMESLRAFMLIRDLEDIAEEIIHVPENVNEDECEEEIRAKGFRIFFDSDKTYEELFAFLKGIVFVERVELIDREEGGGSKKESEETERPVDNIKRSETALPAEPVRHAAPQRHDEPERRVMPAKSDEPAGRVMPAESDEPAERIIPAKPAEAGKPVEESKPKPGKNKVISVSVEKLDMLMNLIGELVISGMMVSQELLSGEEKEESRDKREVLCYQHDKIITDLQDTAMFLRMVPVSVIFSKMRRVVRDMCRRLEVDVNFQVIGEETEIDKNILDSISDPLLHLVRNAVDHGTDYICDRILNGKSGECNITLEARNVGGDVWILVKDDGQGLDYARIYEKACAKGLTSKPMGEMTDAEITSFIFKPGFSTNDSITEFSGRGVGLDVVYENISQIGGSISVESILGEGCTFIIKMPTTLVIVGGLVFGVGDHKYSLPISSVRECIEVTEEELIIDPDGNEAVIIREECYPILRLHKRYHIETNVTKISKGMLIVIDTEHIKYCLFVDKLIGEQQVVVKSLPKWVRKKVKGISGCTLLRDGSISLILEPASLIE